ncbi:hypothetical protein B0H13DRAFT_2678477 [Mycena leptocephala]|nr:hypothetical protein B0H13DRAFT_2678477 [Mycena leptocephala]
MLNKPSPIPMSTHQIDSVVLQMTSPTLQPQPLACDTLRCSATPSPAQRLPKPLTPYRPPSSDSEALRRCSRCISRTLLTPTPQRAFPRRVCLRACGDALHRSRRHVSDSHDNYRIHSLGLPTVNGAHAVLPCAATARSLPLGHAALTPLCFPSIQALRSDCECNSSLLPDFPQFPIVLAASFPPSACMTVNDTTRPGVHNSTARQVRSGDRSAAICCPESLPNELPCTPHIHRSAMTLMHRLFPHDINLKLSSTIMCATTALFCSIYNQAVHTDGIASTVTRQTPTNNSGMTVTPLNCSPSINDSYASNRLQHIYLHELLRIFSACCRAVFDHKTPYCLGCAIAPLQTPPHTLHATPVRPHPVIIRRDTYRGWALASSTMVHPPAVPSVLSTDAARTAFLAARWLHPTAGSRQLHIPRPDQPPGISSPSIRSRGFAGNTAFESHPMTPWTALLAASLSKRSSRPSACAPPCSMYETYERTSVQRHFFFSRHTLSFQVGAARSSVYVVHKPRSLVRV